MIEKINSKILYDGVVKITWCAICVIDFEYNILETSPKLISIYNGKIDDGKLIGTSILERIVDKEALVKKLEEVKAGKTFKDFRASFIKKDKSILTIEISSELLRSEEEEKSIILLSIRDVTEILGYQESLVNKEKRYKLLIENLNEGIWQIDENSVTTYVNKPMADMLGYTEEEMIGKDLFSFMSEDGKRIVNEKIENRKNGVKEQHDFEFLHKNGHTVYAILETGPIIENGEYKGAIAGVQNITDRVVYENKIKESEEMFSSAFKTAPYAVAITNPQNGLFIDVNESFVPMSGYSREELLNNTSIGLGLWVNIENRKEVIERLKNEVPVTDMEFLFRRKNGEIFTGLYSANFIQINNEPHIISSIRDMTDIKAAETEKDRLTAQLQQAQKMEIIGRLAGGVAHNFNNLLTVIKGYTSMILARTNDEKKEELIEIDKAASRASLLTKQLLAFSRKQVLNPVKTNVNELLQNLSKMLATLMGENIKINYELDSDIGLVLVDPAQLEQVIINLATNSKDAMESSGDIFIETKNVNLGDDFISKHGEVIKGNYVMISVRDVGCGMSKDVMLHMWEPFFTTKERGKGTGLGLPTVFGIIKQSNGYIFAESELNEGSIFSVYLPLMPKPSILAKEDDGSESIDNLRGEATILLVEDEDIVRNFTKKLLENNGYKVLDAFDGEKALEISFNYKDKINLLLTDVVLPKMSGKEVSDKISKDRPNCKVIFVSGYTENTVIHQGILVDGVNFVQKPYSIVDLLKKIKRVLDS